jgi:sodium-dependent phosphate cotransporter
LNTLLENRYKTILKIVGVCCALYLFLVGIKGLSIGIKYLGGDFAKTVIATTSNSFVALFIGIISTAIFQSSSTTTSLIVGMVGGGALTLSGAIPMIMGANIGTTITNMIVSIGHINRNNEFRRAFAAATVHDFFNVIAVIILFPLEMIFGILEKSAFAAPTALFSNIPNIISNGNNIITAITLKKSCTVAAAKARLNSLFLLIWPIDTIILVMVVPMFAPMIIGIAPDRVNAPPPTMPTIKEVVVEEL